jgi:putative ABC transport system ATP-binding protein
MPGPACCQQKAWFLLAAPPPAAAGHILCLGALACLHKVIFMPRGRLLSRWGTSMLPRKSLTSGAMPEPAIEISGLEFAWAAGEPLLKIDALRVERAQRLFLTGASGSGKSTLLGLIGGVVRPRSGSIRVIGVPIHELPAGERDRFRGEHLGFIFQMFNLIPYLTIRQNVLLPLQFSRARRERLGEVAPEQEAERLLAALGLASGNLAHRAVTDLSIGQQQRVAAARALIGRPDVLIADEPTSALDADARTDFLQLLMNECLASGTTVLFVSHDRTLSPLFERTIALAEVSSAATATATAAASA